MWTHTAVWIAAVIALSTSLPLIEVRRSEDSEGGQVKLMAIPVIREIVIPNTSLYFIAHPDAQAAAARMSQSAEEESLSVMDGGGGAGMAAAEKVAEVSETESKSPDPPVNRAYFRAIDLDVPLGVSLCL